MNSELHDVIVAAFPEEAVLVGNSTIEALIDNPKSEQNQFVDLDGGDALDIKTVLEILAAAVVLGHELLKFYKTLKKEQKQDINNSDDLLDAFGKKNLEKLTKNAELRSKKNKLAQEIIEKTKNR